MSEEMPQVRTVKMSALEAAIRKKAVEAAAATFDMQLRNTFIQVPIYFARQTKESRALWEEIQAKAKQWIRLQEGAIGDQAVRIFLEEHRKMVQEMSLFIDLHQEQSDG